MAKPIENWLDKSKYPNKASQLSATRWAWEFLRRNPKYQAQWEMVAHIRAEIIGDATGNAAASLPCDDMRFLHFDPPINPGETEAEWRTRVKKGTIAPLDHWIADEWGLHGCTPVLPNPFYSGPNTQLISFDLSSRIYIAGPAWDGLEAQFLTALPEQEAIVFDYRKPLKPQLDAVMEHAEHRQKKLIEQSVITVPSSKNVSSKWPIYLRLLDAELAGANEQEMGKEIYKGQDNSYPSRAVSSKISSNLEVAQSLRDHGYRWLPSINTKNQKKRNK